jgi:Protein of unknown function (DUF732)
MLVCIGVGTGASNMVTPRVGKMLRLSALSGAAVAAALIAAAPAHADGDSYIRYLNDHNIFVPGINDAVRISRGSQVCTSLHNSMTPQQIIDANPIVYFDLRGVIDAAQHELCPDTLH